MMAMRSASRIASSKSWVMKTMVLLQHRLQAHELVLHLAPDQRIERRERLVEEPQFRLHRQRAGDADPLLLAARELARDRTPRARRGRPARSSRAPAPRARSAPCPAPRAERRRCPAPSDAAAGRSAGTPCPSGGGGSRSSAWPRPASRSSPLNRISPAVGSISRDRQRTSVDLPEPDRPMMTKISPSRTARTTSRTRRRSAPLSPRRLPSPRFAAPESARPPGPNSFQTERQASFTGRSVVAAGMRLPALRLARGVKAPPRRAPPRRQGGST